MKKGTRVVVNGEEFEFVVRKGGWTTIVDDEGNERKVRNSAVEEVGEEHGYIDEEHDPEEDHRLVPADLRRYVRGMGETASGNPTLDTADTVADELRGLEIDVVYNVAALEIADFEGRALRTVKAELKERYGNLKNRDGSPNVGMMRMNLGNRLRKVRRLRQAT